MQNKTRFMYKEEYIQGKNTKEINDTYIYTNTMIKMTCNWSKFLPTHLPDIIAVQSDGEDGDCPPIFFHGE